MRRALRITLCSALAMFGHATAAGAEWLLIPFAGVTAGASTGYFNPDNGISGTKPAFGISVTRTGRRISLEVEGTAVPGFFTGDEDGLITSSSIVHLSGNVIANLPSFGRFRPYAVLGGGAIRVRMQDTADVFPVSEWLGALNAGGGVLVPLSGRMSLRGDARYTRSWRGEGHASSIGFGAVFVDYWRVTAGLAIAIK